MTSEREPLSAEDELARRCVDALLEGDRASTGLGMEVVEIHAGKAVVAMVVREDMVNGHDLCHGGLIFTLADSAFAFACNSRNESTLAMNCSIDFMRPALLGDRMVATAVERSKTRSTGVFDVTVRNQDDKVIAHFRGRSSTRGEPLLDVLNGEKSS